MKNDPHTELQELDAAVLARQPEDEAKTKAIEEEVAAHEERTAAAEADRNAARERLRAQREEARKTAVPPEVINRSGDKA